MTGQDDGLRLAVMQDDTVLCADCVHEHQAEGLSGTTALLVHAWLADPAGQTCGGCGATATQSEVRS